VSDIHPSSTATAATAQPLDPAAPRETLAHTEARIAPPAPTVGPPRETQVHIGRVELLVSAPSPPTPPRAAAPKTRAPRAPSAPRDGFSLHRHYLRSS
jgi:hypothetical protein